MAIDEASLASLARRFQSPRLCSLIHPKLRSRHLDLFSVHAFLGATHAGAILLMARRISPDVAFILLADYPDYDVVQNEVLLTEKKLKYDARAYHLFLVMSQVIESLD